MKRIPPSEKMRKKLEALLKGENTGYRNGYEPSGTTNLVERSLAGTQKDKNNSLFFNREICLKISFLSAYQGGKEVA
ncbi:MAG: hypothetical protein LWW94_08880 [Candidatus Desulfofervidaceae bacterium]|nr:hypothetical protein [Candidatus Desulfofervidaceae bacterium]